MKRLIRQLAAIAGLLLAFAVPAMAETVSTTISSTSASYNSSVLYVGPGETASWTLSGTATGTVSLMGSRNGYSYSDTISTAVGAGAVSASGVVRAGTRGYWLRYTVSTITAGSFVCALADQDDKYKEFANGNGRVSLSLYDDSVRITKDLYAPEDVVAGLTTGISTATSSGNSFGPKSYAYLGGGSDVSEGHPVIATTTVAGKGVTVMLAPATTDRTDVIGIAAADTTAGGTVPFYHSGAFCLAFTSGTVNAGDVVVTSATTSGYLYSDTTPTSGAGIAIALESGNAAGGLTKVKLLR